MSPTLLVLAAGMGSRFGGIKQLDGIGPSGETIMDYSIYDAIKSGFNKIVFVIREELLDDFEEIVSSKFQDRIKISYVFQKTEILPDGFQKPNKREKPWGTAHAVWCAKDEIKSPFALINADDFYGRNSFEVMADFLLKLDPNDISKQCLIGFSLDKTLSENGSVSRGVCAMDENGNLTEIEERTKIFKKGNAAVYVENEKEFPLTGKEPVSMNMMGFTPAIFQSIEKGMISFLKEKGHESKAEYYLPIVLNNLVKNGEAQVKVLPTSATWFGMTYKEDRQMVVDNVNELINKGIYPKALWK
jgi:dTDP-glucose pyrophosphorylase